MPLSNFRPEIMATSHRGTIKIRPPNPGYYPQIRGISRCNAATSAEVPLSSEAFGNSDAGFYLLGNLKVRMPSVYIGMHI
jgi:hypothetical protein